MKPLTKHDGFCQMKSSVFRLSECLEQAPLAACTTVLYAYSCVLYVRLCVIKPALPPFYNRKARKKNI